MATAFAIVFLFASIPLTALTGIGILLAREVAPMKWRVGFVLGVVSFFSSVFVLVLDVKGIL